VTLTEGKAPVAPSARATYLPERGGLILLATNLKPLAGDKTYELWVIPANGTAPVPAGLFRPDTSGTATLVLPTLAAGIQAKAFGVTVENAAGTKVPTMPIVLSGAVPSGS
jgi:anti-sigma-K factor RskA